MLFRFNGQPAIGLAIGMKTGANLLEFGEALKEQIEDLRREGWAAWEAAVEATMHRTRPILLTAAAASLALIPISREVFWGPMAYAMMGGIIVGTLLTLLFLPALYVAWFRSEAAHEPAQSMQCAGGPSQRRG